MTYGHVYVARVAMGASDTQTLKAFLEAEAHPGPSLILAYSHCIAHGYDLRYGLDQQKRAVAWHWPPSAPSPRRRARGSARWCWTPAPEYPSGVRPQRGTLPHPGPGPEVAERLLDQAQDDVRQRWRTYAALAAGRPDTVAAVPARPGVGSVPAAPAGRAGEEGAPR